MSSTLSFVSSLLIKRRARDDASFSSLNARQSLKIGDLYRIERRRADLYWIEQRNAQCEPERRKAHTSATDRRHTPRVYDFRMRNMRRGKRLKRTDNSPEDAFQLHASRLTPPTVFPLRTGVTVFALHAGEQIQVMVSSGFQQDNAPRMVRGSKQERASRMLAHGLANAKRKLAIGGALAEV